MKFEFSLSPFHTKGKRKNGKVRQSVDFMEGNTFSNQNLR